MPVRSRVRPSGAPAQTSVSDSPNRDQMAVAQSRSIAAQTALMAQTKRAGLDAKLAEMQSIASPHLRQRTAAFHTMRQQLGSYLPQSIGSKDEIVSRIGLPDGLIGGVPSDVLRRPADPTRPQLVAFATEADQDGLAEKMEAFKASRTKGEIGRAFSGLFSGDLDLDREVVPAMSILFDASSLDSGIAEANEQLGGESAKDLMAGVATARALQQAGNKPRRLHKAVTGRGLGGRLANRVFTRKLPEARQEVCREGAQSKAAVADYVATEARAQLFGQRAEVESQMVDNGLSLDKVGLGALYDRRDTHLAPGSLNLFMQTEEGRKFWLQNIGEDISYAQADALEAATSPLHAEGKLTNAALTEIATKHGLFPTTGGGFFQLPEDMDRKERKASTQRLRDAYEASEGQPISKALLDKIRR